MTKADRYFITWARRNIVSIAFAGAILASLFIRVQMLPYHGGDVNGFLIPWSQEMERRGISFLATGVGNHNVLAQLLLYVCTVLPMDTILALKLFSIVFDYLLAFAMALIVYQLQNEKPKMERRRRAMLMFAVAVLLPLPIFNSAYWAQNEAIYATFVLVCVWCLLKQKYIPAFLWFGVAISVKLQAIFMLPLLVMLYFLHKKFSILSFLIPPATLWLSTLPAILMGAGLWVGFETYFLQTENTPVLFMNYPNVHALATAWDYENLSSVVMVGTMLVLFFMLAWLIWRRAHVQGEGLLLLAAWCPLVCAMLLPGMHERYAFVGEILLWVWAVACPQRKKFIYAFWFSLAGYFAYASFLWGAWPFPAWVPVVNIAVFLVFTRDVARTLGGGFAPLPRKEETPEKQIVKEKTDGA